MFEKFFDRPNSIHSAITVRTDRGSFSFVCDFNSVTEKEEVRDLSIAQYYPNDMNIKDIRVIKALVMPLLNKDLEINDLIIINRLNYTYTMPEILYSQASITDGFTKDLPLYSSIKYEPQNIESLKNTYIFMKFIQALSLEMLIEDSPQDIYFIINETKFCLRKDSKEFEIIKDHRNNLSYLNSSLDLLDFINNFS